jgi:ACT domain-containing protein
MVDMFPFPRIDGNTPEKQISELVSYLIQFKEALEFALMNISDENLSDSLVKKLNELGADIKRSNEDRENEITQISVNTLTIADVCESERLRETIEEQISNFGFAVNFETGELEYTTLTKEEEDSGN